VWTTTSSSGSYFSIEIDDETESAPILDYAEVPAAIEGQVIEPRGGNDVQSNRIFTTPKIGSVNVAFPFASQEIWLP